MRVIAKRFERFGLTLNPEKTKLIEFGRTAWVKGKRTGIKPATFNFLGLTHYCGTTRKGKFSVKVKTMASRLRRSLMRVKELCRKDRHKDLNEQYQRLRSVLTGHYAYYTPASVMSPRSAQLTNEKKEIINRKTRIIDYL